MKILFILIGIITFLCIIMLSALFIDTKYTIQRQIVINRPSKEVYDYVRMQKNQDHYSKWVMADPTMNKDFKGVDGEVGFIYAWDSQDKNVGKGEQEIVNLIDGQQVEAQIRFIRPFENVATTTLTTEAEPGGGTLVTWRMQGNNDYPMNLMNLFMDKLLGNDLHLSLNNLKNILENK